MADKNYFGWFIGLLSLWLGFFVLRSAYSIVFGTTPPPQTTFSWTVFSGYIGVMLTLSVVGMILGWRISKDDW